MRTAHDIHPLLRDLARNATTERSLAELTAQEARAGIAARTAARGAGPAIDQVVDRAIPGPGGDIPARLYQPAGAPGVVKVADMLRAALVRQASSPAQIG